MAKMDTNGGLTLYSKVSGCRMHFHDIYETQVEVVENDIVSERFFAAAESKWKRLSAMM